MKDNKFCLLNVMDNDNKKDENVEKINLLTIESLEKEKYLKL